MQIYPCVYKFVGMGVCISVCMSVHIYVCMYMHVHMCICICIHTLMTLCLSTPLSFLTLIMELVSGLVRLLILNQPSLDQAIHLSHIHLYPIIFIKKVFTKKNVQLKQEMKSQLNMRLNTKDAGDQELAGSSCSLPHRRAPAAPKAVPGL